MNLCLTGGHLSTERAPIKGNCACVDTDGTSVPTRGFAIKGAINEIRPGTDTVESIEAPAIDFRGIAGEMASCEGWRGRRAINTATARCGYVAREFAIRDRGPGQCGAFEVDAPPILRCLIQREIATG